LEVVEARDEEVVWGGDGPCCAPEFDHQASPVGMGCVIENDEKIDVGVGPVGTVGHGTEQHDLRWVECSDDRGHEIGHPVLERSTSPLSVAVTARVGDLLHGRRVSARSGAASLFCSQRPPTGDRCLATVLAWWRHAARAWWSFAQASAT